MGIMDFLFGTEDQTVMDPKIKRARDFLLDQMMQQYQAGPINVPQYMAVAPAAQYSGANALLSSLGLEPVIAPALPTTNVGGIDVYTSQPFQEQIEQSYAERYPEQYDFLRSFYMDPVTGARRPNPNIISQPSVQPVVSQGGDNDDDPLALHYSIFGQPNSLMTGQPSAASQAVFSQADLEGNHGGSYISKIGSDISKAVTGGGIMGAIADLFSNDDDDPSIGNVP